MQHSASSSSILLVNLGSPRSTHPYHVFRYLTEFLTDPCVIELPFWKRQLLVRGLIVPFRFLESAANYKKVWTEEGSPLIVWGEKVRLLLEKSLNLPVHLAMRYQKPSIKEALERIKGPVIVVPLFPQYADATTGSIVQEVKKWRPDATFAFLQPDHPTMIRAMAAQVTEDFDHLLMSFHGLPVKQDRTGYREACYQTAAALGKELGRPYHVSFQSRLGKEPWLEPYTSDVLPTLEGNVAVMSPSFVADCVETTYELGMEYRPLYKGPLISCMNDHPIWIDSLKEQIEACL
ncbi:MAG: ferrochelatase [Chlamydiota bacterium]